MLRIPTEGELPMPTVLLESGEPVGEVEGLPPPGSEIVLCDGRYEGIFVVVRQRWMIAGTSTGKCSAIVVRPRGISPAGGPAGAR